MKDVLDILRVMELDGVVEFVGVGLELRPPKPVDARPTEELDPDWLPPAEKAMRLESGGGGGLAFASPSASAYAPASAPAGGGGRGARGARGAVVLTPDEELERRLAADPELPERRYRLCPTRIAPQLASQRLRWEDVPNQLDYLADFRCAHIDQSDETHSICSSTSRRLATPTATPQLEGFAHTTCTLS